jgi:hypothetical protein
MALDLRNVATGLLTGGIAMTTYKILTARTPVTLENLVNDALKQGWELHGGLVVATATETEVGWFQAMVKRS